MTFTRVSSKLAVKLPLLLLKIYANADLHFSKQKAYQFSHTPLVFSGQELLLSFSVASTCHSKRKIWGCLESL